MKFLDKSKREWAKTFWPTNIRITNQLNRNADFQSFAAEHVNAIPFFGHRKNLYHDLHARFVGKKVLTYLEFGVWKGVSLEVWIKQNQNSASRFYGFDSFMGLPEDWNVARPQGSFDTGGQLPVIGDPRVRFVCGWFQDTLPGFLEKTQLDGQIVIHIDCDLYSSTLFCLTTLDRALPEGTILIFDEFYDLEHEYAAFADYVKAYCRAWKVIAATKKYSQVAIKLEGRHAHF